VTNSFLLSVCAAIANHLWQTTVFAAAIWLAALFLRDNRARIRYSLWLAASAKFLLPFSLLIAVGSFLPRSDKIAPPAMYSTIGLVEEPFSQLGPAPAASVNEAPNLRERIVSDLPIGLGSIWVCGVGIVLLMWSFDGTSLRLTYTGPGPRTLGGRL
jgi:bla regulator protein blaR1